MPKRRRRRRRQRHGLSRVRRGCFGLNKSQVRGGREVKTAVPRGRLPRFCSRIAFGLSVQGTVVQRTLYRPCRRALSLFASSLFIFLSVGIIFRVLKRTQAIDFPPTIIRHGGSRYLSSLQALHHPSFICPVKLLISQPKHPKIAVQALSGTVAQADT